MRTCQHLAVAGCLSALAAAAGSANPAAAKAILRLDQQQPRYTGALTVRSGAAQTITVGIAGTLRRVALPMCATSRGATVLLSITDAGSGRLIVGGTLTFTAAYSDCAWYTIDFSTPNHITRGERLRLTVTKGRGVAPLWACVNSGGDPYPRGSGSWRGHVINDFAFRSYVETGS